MSQEIVANLGIRAPTVRLVEADGRQIGVVTLQEANRRAREAGLDLVQVALTEMPICRILDLDRYRFERSKADREIARRQRETQVETKEIQLRPVTGSGDLAVKARHANEFLAQGDKVKVVIRFRGRERTHREEGDKVLESFMSMISEHRVDAGPRNGDRDTTMILSSVVNKAELTKSRR